MDLEEQFDQESVSLDEERKDYCLLEEQVQAAYAEQHFLTIQWAHFF